MNTKQNPPPINRLIVRGFKSIRDRTELATPKLSLLAGINSSGKSSLMQSLLLMKQTIDATFDPGPLLLDGPNVRFSRIGQLFWQGKTRNDSEKTFDIEFSTGRNKRYRHQFAHVDGKVRLDGLEITDDKGTYSISENLSPAQRDGLHQRYPMPTATKEGHPVKYEIRRNRCSLDIAITDEVTRSEWVTFLSQSVFSVLGSVIHLPGLRGNAERTYPKSLAVTHFPGTFEKYTASILAAWSDSGSAKLEAVGQDLLRLGLTWKVESQIVDDTRVELRVGRLPRPQRGGAKDMVSIADVGVGVSQALPVVVALHAATPGQLVFVEQPEIHLHPRAQAMLAELLADAIGRGVQVVVETHSELLLLSLQELVSRGQIATDDLALHWFERTDDGATTVKSTQLHADGSYGDWPVDFARIRSELDKRYIKNLLGLVRE